MSWLAETHGRQLELTRHFLRRMFDGEWSAAPGQWKSAAVGLVSLFLPAGLLLVREGSLDPKYAFRYRLLAMAGRTEALRAAAVADELALVTLLMCVTGLVALLQWQSLFPGRRDYLALASLPVRSRQIFAARFTAVLLFSFVIIGSLNLLPSIVAPMEFGRGWRLDSSFVTQAEAQFATSGLACFFIFFAILGLQGALLNLLPRALFVRVSSYAQGLLTCVFLLGGLYSWSIKEWSPEMVAKLPGFGAWLPPVWFTSFHQTLIGEPAAFDATMAERGWLAAGAAAAVSILTYLAVYRRYRALLLEAPAQVTTSKAWHWTLTRLLAHSPRREAVMDFLSKTLARSRVHQLLWLAYLGAAAAVVLNSSLIDGAIFIRSKGGWVKTLHFLVLFWPLACSVVVLSGFRHVLSIPSELQANWIFRMTESLGRSEWMSAVERFVMAYAIAPIYIVLFPVSVYILGWGTAARMTALQVLISLSAFELLFNDWQKLPFTCSHVPGRRPLAVVVGLYLAVLGAVVPVLSVMIATVSAVWFLFPIYMLNFILIWFWLRRLRRDGWGEAKLIYEELPEVVTDLGIRDVTYSGNVTQRPGAAALGPDSGDW